MFRKNSFDECIFSRFLEGGSFPNYGADGGVPPYYDDAATVNGGAEYYPPAAAAAAEGDPGDLLAVEEDLQQPAAAPSDADRLARIVAALNAQFGGARSASADPSDRRAAAYVELVGRMNPAMIARPRVERTDSRGEKSAL